MAKSPAWVRQLTAADYHRLAAFRHALRGFLAFSAGEAEAVGLAPQQHQALLAIRGWDEERPPTIKALAGQLIIRHNSAVELVRRLEDAGFVRCVPSHEDRRQIELSLTKKGDAALAALSASHLAELRQRGPRLVAILEELIAK
ncbi:MAG: MarR family transcriptional regulator [Methylovirgula sp.]